jgi:hypothetical protein
MAITEEKCKTKVFEKSDIFINGHIVWRTYFFVCSMKCVQNKKNILGSCDNWRCSFVRFSPPPPPRGHYLNFRMSLKEVGQWLNKVSFISKQWAYSLTYKMCSHANRLNFQILTSGSLTSDIWIKFISSREHKTNTCNYLGNCARSRWCHSLLHFTEESTRWQHQLKAPLSEKCLTGITHWPSFPRSTLTTPIQRRYIWKFTAHHSKWARYLSQKVALCVFGIVLLLTQWITLACPISTNIRSSLVSASGTVLLQTSRIKREMMSEN